MKISDDSIANPGVAGARAAAAFSGQPDVEVQITRTPRKLAVDLDALPPAREDGPRPIPRRFTGRMYEQLKSSGFYGDGMSVQKSAESYGVCKIHITRDIIGVNGAYWYVGDEIAGVPVNLAVTLVGDKSAYFDKSEFKSEGEIEALEKLGYRVEPPMIKARDRQEFQPVIAKRHPPGKWMAPVLTPQPGEA